MKRAASTSAQKVQNRKWPLFSSFRPLGRAKVRPGRAAAISSWAGWSVTAPESFSEIYPIGCGIDSLVRMSSRLIIELRIL
jgi:hypothetical protein